MKAVFLRAIEVPVDDKAALLRASVRQAAVPGTRFEVDLDGFRQVPRSPFAYWVSNKVTRVFRTYQRLHAGRSKAWSTNPLNEDFRFARAYWEPRPSRIEVAWKPWAKGGAFSPFYYDIVTVISWSDQRQSYGSFIGTVNRPLTRPASLQHFFRPGLTWPRRTNGLSFRAMPAGCIFADKGPAIFVQGDQPEQLLALCAVLNSQAFGTLVRLQLARTELAQSFEVGLIQQTPVPQLSGVQETRLADLARHAWSLKRTLDTRVETSHAFSLPALLQVDPVNLQGRADAWSELAASHQQRLDTLQAEIDALCFDLYGIEPEDRQCIESGGLGAEVEATGEADQEAEDDEALEVDAAPMVASLLAWCVGVAFGRFDLRLAIGERPMLPEPEPFDPLPACSPGMLTGDDGLPLDSPPTGYPITFPPDGILVDDPGHPCDLVQAVRTVFETVFDDPSTRWHEATELLDVHDLRTWFAQAFFEQHIKRYSKSRRKAPIYWQLATPSGAYSVWLYIHRATPDTLFRVLNDYVGPKLDHEQTKLARLIQESGVTPSAAQRREIDQQEGLVTEIQVLKAEVARVAPMWRPDLDDGVILNFAPLWRLTPQHRTWQNECRKAWDKLFSGDYDWAHVAMHLWPERVAAKCSEDRSIAIAHGLEELFWCEDEAGTWQQRPVEDAQIGKLVSERTSPTVKAALKDLLSAPAMISVRGRKKAAAPAGRARGIRKRIRPSAVSGETATGGRPARSPDADLMTAVREAIGSQDGGASKSDVIAATSLSDAQWNVAISALLADGVVTKSGAARGTRYHLKPEP